MKKHSNFVAKLGNGCYHYIRRKLFTVPSQELRTINKHRKNPPMVTVCLPTDCGHFKMLITNILNLLLQQLYCLDIGDVILLLIAATGFAIYLHECFSRKTWWRLLLGLALICWAAVVAYTTVSSRSDGQQFVCHMTIFHSYQEILQGGNPEILRSNFMNIVLFYPAGFISGILLPRRWPGWLRCGLVVLLLTAMSIGIECMQYHFGLGRCEIDDVLHNTVGALLGVLFSLYAIKYAANSAQKS